MKKTSMWWRVLTIFALTVLVLGPAGAGQGVIAAGTSPAPLKQTDPPPEFQLADQQLQVSQVQEGVNLEGAAFTSDGRVLVIVELAEPPLALYSGGIRSLAPTSVEATGSTKLQVDAPAAQAYVNYLRARQDAFIASAAQISSNVTVNFTYQTAFNGVAIAIEPDRVNELLKLPGVRRVYPDQIQTIKLNASTPLINAPAAWEVLGGQDQAGSGVFVAVIDSGIYPTNPMFTGDGFTMPSGYPRGFCETNPSDPDFQCTNKLVAARHYPPPMGSISVHPEEVLTSPLDVDGHGSHVAGIAAGRRVTIDTSDPFNNITVPEPVEISGVAPGAYLMAYKGLYHTTSGNASGTNSMLLGALNDALADGADVVNNSWGGGPGDPATSPFLSAIQALVASNVVVVFAAGNEGPGDATIGCPSCVEETISVAASTTTKRYVNVLSVTGPSAPAELQNLEMLPGSGGEVLLTDLNAPLLYAGEEDPGNEEGCSAFPPGAFDGAIALISRGTCAFVDKIDNAADAGAEAVVIFNNAGDELINMNTEGTTIPAFFISQTNGENLVDFIEATAEEVTAMIPASPVEQAVEPDVMASFSSVGPNFDGDILKPDITAPGVDILSAYSPVLEGYNFRQVSGTSQATPHVSGAAALMRALHPTWTVDQIRTALVTTAVQTLSMPEGSASSNPTPFNMGSGRLDLERAINAGVTFDHASFAEDECLLSCSWTRQIRSVSDTETTWTAHVIAPEGVTISVTPSTFTLPPGLIGEFTVTVDGQTVSEDDWFHGAIIWEESTGTHPDAYMPLSVNFTSAQDASVLTKTADVDSVEPGGTVTYTIELTNPFSIEETFIVRDVLPENLTYVDGSATGGLTYDATENALEAVVTLDPASLMISDATGDSPAGYLPLTTITPGLPPLPCSAECDSVLIDLNVPPFFYNGQMYTSITMSDDGYAVPGGTAASEPFPEVLPNPNEPNNMLAPFWTDIDMDGTSPTDTGGGNWYANVVTDGVSDFTVLEWQDVQRFEEDTTSFSFQIWIEVGTSNIWFTYGPLTGSLDPVVVGAESEGGEIGDTWYANIGGTEEGTPVAEGDELVVATEPGGSVTFTFEATASEDISLGTRITNVVEARAQTMNQTFIAFAATLIEYSINYLPLIFRDALVSAPPAP